MYYYRVEMLNQRLDWMERLDLLPNEKLNIIRDAPPALILTFDSTEYDAPLVYIRGLIKSPDTHQNSASASTNTLPEPPTIDQSSTLSRKHLNIEDFVQVCYPVSRYVTLSPMMMDQRISEMAEKLDIVKQDALELILSVPVYFMHPMLLQEMKHLCVHRFMLPYKFDPDKHTMNMLPPISNTSTFDESFWKRFASFNVSSEEIADLPVLSMNEALNLNSYTDLSDYGTTTPECLSSFLVKAEFEEL